MPLFTVLIPAYNRADLLPAAVESVLAQRFGDWEIVIVDDGSTDDTPAVCARLEQPERIRVYRQPNGGPAAARNLGIQQARGVYVAFLDSDDLWFPWTLENFARVIAGHNQPAAVAGSNRPFEEPEQLRTLRTDPTGGPFRAERFADLLAFYEQRPPECFQTGVMAVRTDVLRAANGFWPHRWHSEDIDLWLRIGTATGFVRLYEPPAYGHRHHAGNISREVTAGVLGIRQIMQNERAGIYPGGSARRSGRLKVLTFIARALSMGALRAGMNADAWGVYRGTFIWNLRLGRLKYLLGFVVRVARPRRRPAAHASA